jgi:hypothetical protein
MTRTLEECLQFSAKRDLVLESAALMQKLEVASKTKAKTLSKRTEDLRNDLTHSQPASRAVGGGRR